ncbi:hypothetical protein [Sphingomonas mesophila]|uniref:hypothetical protein n=1 Tax=Sphingomonas mesophila TaxID=2303576 RepID=UPI000E57293A|nr:hypothetical protein [Sphingomonas mesophila]
MTAFELFFGLSSVILGLALAQIANSLQLLLRAGRRVKWAPEPVLQAVLILLIVVSVWTDQWNERDVAAFTVGQCLLQVVKLLALFIASAAVLPETHGDGAVDLKQHYFDARPVTWGALVTGLILFLAYAMLFGGAKFSLASFAEWAFLPALYTLLIFVRWRPLHLGALIFVVVVFSIQILGIRFG